MNEEWKWIKGYENLYQISNKGRIKSFLSYKNGMIMSLKNQYGWYFTVNLKDKNGNKSTKRIHRIVCETFIGEIPKGYHVHHKDGNKQNNCVENLEIIHPKEHVKETMKNNPDFIKGMNNYNKFVKPKTINQYDLDGNWLASYCNSEFASEFTGVCQRNILQVAAKTPYGKNNRKENKLVGLFGSFLMMNKGVIINEYENSLYWIKWKCLYINCK